MLNISHNYSRILKEINERAKLLAVTKGRSVEEIKHLYDLGHRDFGENRVEELLEKASLLPSDISWHFIGNLQRKKIKKLLGLKNLEKIHSVSSLSIISELNKFDLKVKVYLQVNSSLEKEKSGFLDISSLKEALCLAKNHISINGLMTMGKMRTSEFEEDARKCFKTLNQMRLELNPSWKLSMGMSSDYKIALEEGSDCLRLGSILFS